MDAFTEMKEEILRLQREKAGQETPILIALDGRCASGKTTLAGALAADRGCLVFHMDDFFLRPEQRTEERLAAPGGNVDYERFRAEVLEPLLKGEDFSYRPFDCSTMQLGEKVKVILKGNRGEEPRPLTALVEGAYSCHPTLWDFYDYRAFCTVSKEEQERRIRRRNGDEGWGMFENKWIPLEERYFAAFSVEERCSRVL